MKTNFINKIALSIFASFFCYQLYINAQEINNTNAVKSDTTWKYLGPPRPGMTPLRFPPDSLLANNNGFWHGSPMFSPDLKEMYWSKYTIYPTYNRTELVFVKYENFNWTSMQYITFGNLNYSENNPFFSFSGDTLYFQSQRPDGFIFRVTRSTSGWSQPVPLNLSKKVR